MNAVSYFRFYVFNTIRISIGFVRDCNTLTNKNNTFAYIKMHLKCIR